MKPVVLATCIVLSVFLLFSCSKEPTSISGSPSAKGSAKIKLVADSGSAFGSIAHSATAMVTGSGMDTLKCPLSITSNSVSGTIANIVAGTDRQFQVFVDDTGGHVCYYGQASADVVANGTINVPMTLYLWNKGDAVINGSIVDSLPSPECYADTLPLPWGYPVGVTPISHLYVRRICHGDTILDTIFHGVDTIPPVDTMPPYVCYALDSTCFPVGPNGGTMCYVRKVCHGDTLIDTVFHPDSNSVCRVVDSTRYVNGSDTLYMVRRVCNGQTFIDTIPISNTPVDVKFIMPNLSSNEYYYLGDTIRVGAAIINGAITCVSKITFYCDSAIIGTIGSSVEQPYYIISIVLAQTPGVHNLYAVVYDCNGKAWYSNRQPVQVRWRGSINY